MMVICNSDNLVRKKIKLRKGALCMQCIFFYGIQKNKMDTLMENGHKCMLID